MQPTVTYNLTGYQDWDPEIEDAIGRFISRFGV